MKAIFRSWRLQERDMEAIAREKAEAREMARLGIWGRRRNLAVSMTGSDGRGVLSMDLVLGFTLGQARPH
jgi:hypothetical protein